MTYILFIFIFNAAHLPSSMDHIEFNTMKGCITASNKLKMKNSYIKTTCLVNPRKL